MQVNLSIFSFDMNNLKQNIWITFLIAMMFVGVLGVILPKNPDKYLKNRFWTLKVHSKSKYNFIILGDSRSYRDISPYEIENILPEFRVFNFGFSNGGLNSTIFEAADRRLLENDSLKVILMGVSALTINNLSLSNEQYLQELLRPREEVLENIYFGRFLYFFSPISPEVIKDLIKGDKPAVNYTNIYHDNGWVESQKIPSDTMEAMPYYIEDFKLHKTNYQLVDDMCDKIRIWTSKGVKVFAFRPPAALPIVSLEDSVGEYKEQLIEEKIESAGGYWINVDPAMYKTYDGSHLSKEEACKLSRYIAVKIKTILNSDYESQ